jgi:sugar lactone lactonase YvrE
MSLTTRSKAALLAATLCVVMSEASAFMQGDTPTGPGLPNPYDTVRNWGMLPGGRTWGSTAGLDIGPDGQVWAYDRCGANSCEGSTLDPILKFDRKSGKLLTSFGGGLLVFPHGLHVDKDGNVWITDAAGSKDGKMGHQVIKFGPDGKVLLRLGKAGVAGDPPEALNEPCDVVTAPNGDIFVSEGHSGQNDKIPPGTVGRISKFTKDGKFIKSFGRLGSGPAEFRTPHALVFDSQGRLIVADRGNMRIQIFDQEGKTLLPTPWKQFSRVSGLFIDKNDMLYAIDSETNEERHPGWKKGVRIGSVKDGKIVHFIPPHQTDRPEGAAGEGVAVDPEGNVYGAEVTIRGLTKYVKKT